MDYPSAKFGDFCLSRFGFYRADRQTYTDRQTELQRPAGATTVQIIGISS